MSLKTTVLKIPFIRSGAIRLLKLFKRDIKITNNWTGHTLNINSYHHKSYWYYGREREKETMHFFSRLICKGDTVIEVGGHIGFITQYFSKLVGAKGKVVVFEPGSNNIPYIEENVRSLSNTTLVREAVASRNGTATFYEDNVTGQNNSLRSSFKGAETVARSHGEDLVLTAHEVDLVTIDCYVAEHMIMPDFIKIDVEGCEYEVLLGARKTLPLVRSLMVEVSEQPESVMKLLQDAGFNVYDEQGRKTDTILRAGNYFAVH